MEDVEVAGLSVCDSEQRERRSPHDDGVETERSCGQPGVEGFDGGSGQHEGSLAVGIGTPDIPL